MTLSKRIVKSNKFKTTWNIMNELLGKQSHSQDTREIIIGEKHLRNQRNIVEAFIGGSVVQITSGSPI